jgi:hypothetical protein
MKDEYRERNLFNLFLLGTNQSTQYVCCDITNYHCRLEKRLPLDNLYLSK